ncbi:MAG: hypothetical protein KIT39_21235 [Nitrospirales bacterium]|nr:hypothetical protein [Nitrospirales bacterium]
MKNPLDFMMALLVMLYTLFFLLWLLSGSIEWLHVVGVDEPLAWAYYGINIFPFLERPPVGWKMATKGITVLGFKALSHIVGSGAYSLVLIES